MAVLERSRKYTQNLVVTEAFAASLRQFHDLLRELRPDFRLEAKDLYTIREAEQDLRLALRLCQQPVGEVELAIREAERKMAQQQALARAMEVIQQVESNPGVRVEYKLMVREALTIPLCESC